MHDGLPMTLFRQRNGIDLILRLITIATLLFLFIPIGFIVAHSFTDARAFFVWGGFTTKWYSSMWDNAQLTNSVLVSFKAAAGSTLIAVVLGSFAASLASRLDEAGDANNGKLVTSLAAKFRMHVNMIPSVYPKGVLPVKAAMPAHKPAKKAKHDDHHGGGH